LGVGYDTYQYFGANATRSTILKDWIAKIEDEKDKTPIGIVFNQLNATTIEGRFVYEGDDITGKMFRKLK